MNLDYTELTLISMACEQKAAEFTKAAESLEEDAEDAARFSGAIANFRAMAEWHEDIRRKVNEERNR